MGIKKYLVIQCHTSEYPEPITLTKGTPLTVGGKYEGLEGWNDWFFFNAPGQKGGWVPAQVIEIINGNTARAREDYTARELNVQAGDLLKTCIVKLVSIFQSQPYTFLFESDLQAYLYASLRSQLSESLEVHGSGNPEHIYKTGIVNTEYWRRIDIVCLDPESVQWSRIRTHMGSDLHICELPILVGIELKYRKMGDVFGLSSCHADLKKLNAHKIQYQAALGFLQNRFYADTFFTGNSSQRDCIDVSAIDPFGSVHVISPGKVWKIHISTSS